MGDDSGPRVDLDAHMREHVMCDHKHGQCGIADDRRRRDELAAEAEQ